MRVSEARTRDVRIARPDQTIQDAAKMMSDVDAGGCSAHGPTEPTAMRNPPERSYWSAFDDGYPEPEVTHRSTKIVGGS
jgi:hypothetical protein